MPKPKTKKIAYKIAPRNSQTLPAKNRHTKLWGLNVLKEVAKGDPRWTIPKHHVLTSISELEKKHIADARRVLIRTDENGAYYTDYNYPSMPRNELKFARYEPMWIRTMRTKKLMEKMNVDLHTKDNPEVAKDFSEKGAKFLLLPTKARSEIKSFGSIAYINKTNPVSVVYHSQPFSKEHSEHMRTHTLDTNVFSLNFAKDGNISESEIKKSSRLTDSQNMDSESARELMLKLLKSGKLDTKKGTIAELFFLRWKGAKPGNLEFYDLGHEKYVNP